MLSETTALFYSQKKDLSKNFRIVFHFSFMNKPTQIMIKQRHVERSLMYIESCFQINNVESYVLYMLPANFSQEHVRIYSRWHTPPR